MNPIGLILHRSMAANLSLRLFWGSTAFFLPISAVQAAGSSLDQPMAVVVVSIAHMFSVLALKITAFVIGYKIARLGYETLVKGITGEFDFGFSSGKSVSAKLKSASPGTLFVLLGTAIIAWGLFVQKPFESELLQKSSAGHQSQQAAHPPPEDSDQRDTLPGPK